MSGNDTGSAASNVVTTNLLDSYSIIAQKDSANSSFRAGENITYLVTVTNTGTQPLYNVQISDDLAAGQLTYLAGSALVIDGSTTVAITPVSTAPLVLIAADVLNSGESVTVLYVARVAASIPDSVLTLTNTANVQANEGSAEGAVIEVVPAPTVTLNRADYAQVEVVKSVDKAVISSGDTLTYTFTLENTGNIPATDVVITDALPTGFVITSITSQTGSVITVFNESDYTVDASNILTLPTSDVSITVPAATEAGAGVTVVTVVGTVTG